MKRTVVISKARETYHAAILDRILTVDKKGVPSNADKHNSGSVRIAFGLVERMGASAKRARLAGQKSGNRFEELTTDFLRDTFLELRHLRPGQWHIAKVGGGSRSEIAKYDQYAHLVALQRAAQNDPELAAALGSDYTITPDILVARLPETDQNINGPQPIVDGSCANQTSLRARNNRRPILHASISCKWSIRSDRVQNARSEGLNLMKNRKGHTPHIVVVAGEPLPSRIAAIALGTGEIDCVYHMALPELQESVKQAGMDDAADLLKTMVDGKRLKDISDLPLDLAV